MAINAGPKIVEDGLVFCVDAANKKSYPRTGTVWTDLTANKKTGTFSNMNTANFSNDGVGSLTFDGSNEQVNFGDIIDISSNYTLECWFKGSATQSTDYIGIFAKDSPSNFGNYGFFGDSGSNYVRFGFRDTSGIQKETSNSNYNDIKSTLWVHYVGTYDFSSLILYRNGINIASSSANTTPETNSNPLSIGNRYTNNRWFTGHIAMCRIYNRALSAQEITQNYNATKGRYT
jgi:hypothetical protein